VSDPAFREYVEAMTRELPGRVDVRELVEGTSAFDLFSFEHGYKPAAPRTADLVSCMFLHGSLMHLFGNMLFLWIYGDNVERRLGAVPYLLAYLLTGAAATLTHALVFPSSGLPLVGASGAISGVLGFYFVFFPRNTVRMLAFLPPFLMQVFEIPARYVLGMYLLVDNLLPFLFVGEGGVAHGAHIGGFVAGGLAAWVMDRRGLAPRAALSADDAVARASRLRDSGQPDAALQLLRRVVRDVPRGEGLAEAYALAGVILLEDRSEPTAAYQYLLTALELGLRPETAAAVRQRLAAIEGLQKRQVGRLHAPPRF
jgi:membrane associated rhomboid family serine protease